MLERLRQHIQESRLIPDGSSVVVGFSGGADSTCLLHLLHGLGIDTVAAHLNHGQRAEAEGDECACRSFAEGLGTQFVSGNAQVPKMAEELRIGIEEAGRRARYAFLERVAHGCNAALIATAHTKSDHVETVIHHIVRGTGLAGLAGIPERRDNIVRPLLIFERADTARYCAERGLPVLEDPGNSDLSFSRARIRHRILPEMRQINPGVYEAVTRLSQIASDEDRFMNGMAAAALERSEVVLNGELSFLTNDLELGLDRARLEAHPPVLVRRGIRLAVEVLGSSFDHHQTALVTEGLASAESGSVTAEGGEVVVEWSKEMVRIQRLTNHRPFRWALELPGETESVDLGWRLVGYRGAASGDRQTRGSLVVQLDQERLKGTLYFKGWEAADRIQPLGFQGSRKVSSLLNEAKLSFAAKQRLPIICDVLGPVWIPGICVSGRAVANEHSKSVIALRFEPIARNRSHNGETLSTSRA